MKSNATKTANAIKTEIKALIFFMRDEIFLKVIRDTPLSILVKGVLTFCNPFNHFFEKVGNIYSL
jgi:hypothetical protein